MAAIKLLYIGTTTGLPTEMDAADTITLGSFTVNGGGPVLGSNLDMNNANISDVNFISFTDPTTDGFIQTAGTLTMDNVMAKDRDNLMAASGAIIFPTCTDTAGSIDAFKIPDLAGPPSAVPSYSTSPGYMVYDVADNLLKVWNGSQWRSDVTTANSAPQVLDNATFVAGATIAVNDLVYISGEGAVSPCDANAEATSRAIGFATSAGDPAASISVQLHGVRSGFSGLVAGGRLFLSEASGQATTTVGTTAGMEILQAGYAANSTSVYIAIQHLGVRN